MIYAVLVFTYQEQKDFETIEEDISRLENAIAEKEAAILLAATDFVKLNTLSQEKEKLEADLNEKLERYLFLEDKAQQIQNQ